MSPALTLLGVALGAAAWFGLLAAVAALFNRAERLRNQRRMAMRSRIARFVPGALL